MLISAAVTKNSLARPPQNPATAFKFVQCLHRRGLTDLIMRHDLTHGTQPGAFRKTLDLRLQCLKESFRLILVNNHPYSLRISRVYVYIMAYRYGALQGILQRKSAKKKTVSGETALMSDEIQYSVLPKAQPSEKLSPAMQFASVQRNGGAALGWRGLTTVTVLTCQSRWRTFNDRLL